MADEDFEKKEQERILRTITKGRGKAPPLNTAARTSWNVHLSGRAVGGVTKKNEQAEAFRALQEQIKNEEASAFNVAVTNAATAEQPYNAQPPKEVSPLTSPLSTSTPTASTAPSLNLEEQAEHNAASAFNEKRELERINKWTRGMGKESPPKKVTEPPHHDRPVPAVLLRQFDVDDHTKPAEHPKPHTDFAKIVEQAKHAEAVKHAEAAKHAELTRSAEIAAKQAELTRSVEEEHKQPLTPVKEKDKTEYLEGVVKFTNNVAVAAKALRQQNSEALVTACFSVVVSAKILAGVADDDADITGWAKALECVNTELRSRLDGGRSGNETYNEISRTIGQLYLSVVSLT